MVRSRTPPASCAQESIEYVVSSSSYRFANLLLVRGLHCWAIDDLPGVMHAATEGIRHSRAARDRARDQLGGRFKAEFEAGKLLTPVEAVALALDPG